MLEIYNIFNNLYGSSKKILVSSDENVVFLMFKVI